jgi:hypothetical protein
VKKIIISAALLSLSMQVHAHDIWAYAYNMTSLTGNPVYLTSVHHMRFINNTDVMKNYKYMTQLCADNKGCTDPINKSINVPPHDEKTIQYEMYLPTTFYHAGRYNITATTDTFGEGAEHRQGLATITVN